MNHEKPVNIGDLFQRMESGDRQAFCDIYRIFYNRLFKYGLVISDGDHTQIEDVLQDFFLEIWQNPERFSHVINHEVYLLRSVKHATLAAMKQLAKSAKVYRIDQHLTNSESMEKAIISHEQEKERLDWLEKSLEELPRRLREAIHLRFYQSLDYEEISDLMSVSKQVARNFVSRAIKRLRNNRTSERISS